MTNHISHADLGDSHSGKHEIIGPPSSDALELYQPPVARSESSPLQRPGSVDAANDSSDAFTGTGLASRVALALISDEKLRRSVVRGFQESPEKFREYLPNCICLLADKLEDDATLEYERKAASFIAEHGFAIAHRIQSELEQPNPPGETALGDERATSSFPEFLSEAFYADQEIETISKDDLIQTNFAAVQRFILGSPYLPGLIVRLEQYVDDLYDRNEAQSPRSQQEMRCERNFFWQISSQIRRIMEPKPRPGTVRVRWTCSCGVKMWDDYSQRTSNDLGVLEARLNKLFRTVPNGPPTARDSNIAFNPRRSLQRLGNSFLALLRGAVSRVNARQHDPENTTPPPSSQAEPDANIYFLTCVDAGIGLPTLFQKKVNSAENDKAYFQMLRTLYDTNGAGRWNWLTFKTVTAIEYVRVCDSCIQKINIYYTQLMF